MRRIVTTVVVLGTLLCASSVAMAHGYYHSHRGFGPRGMAVAPYRMGYGYARRAYVPAYVMPGYGLGYGLGYGVGYGPAYGGVYGGYGAYPQLGFGINGSNFGLWYQQ